MVLQTAVPGVAWHGSWSPVGAADTARVADLPAVQRLLLTTDGALTPLLETLLGEPIAVRVLDQSETVARDPDLELALFAGARIVERRVLLSGAHAQTPLVFASSRIALDRLAPRVAADLVDGGGAIGLVLRAHAVETYRVALRIGIGPASAGAAAWLGDTTTCRRRYAIRSGGRPLMLVDEQFPAAGFGTED